MFGAKKTHRRFHRKCTLRQRRYAIVSAIAATGSPGLVMSKGHQISKTREIPLVVSDEIEGLKKTKQAVAMLRKHNAWADVKRVYASIRNRAGKGKMRNRRKMQRKGPLVIYSKNNGLSLAFRNIPGVETMCVDHLNLLKLAPGGHVGRFCIWTEGAMSKLDSIYGTYHSKSETKKDFNLPQPIMTSSDLMGLLKNEDIRKHLKKPKLHRTLSDVKLNPLKNMAQLFKLNPYARVEKKAAAAQQKENLEKKAERAEKRKIKLSLAKRRANNVAIVKAARKALAKQKALKRLGKTSGKAHDKDLVKPKPSVKELKAHRAAKAAEYKKKNEEYRAMPKKTKKAVAKPEKKQKVVLTEEQKAAKKEEKKKAFKARKSLKAKAAKKPSAVLQKVPEVVSARKQAAREARQKKAAEQRKIAKRIAKYVAAVKANPNARKATKYAGKNRKYAKEAKAKNAKAVQFRAAERAKVEKA